MPETIKLIRQQILAKRRELSTDWIHDVSHRIQSQVSTLEVFQKASRLALYYPIAGEVETWEVFRKAHQTGKQTFFPRVEGDHLQFVAIDSPESFVMEQGIPQPIGTETGPSDSLHCILVPGVAFDQAGYRLGFGRGYYDRVLAGYRGATVGIAYDFQVVKQLPHHSGDIPCDCVVTEQQIIWRHL